MIEFLGYWFVGALLLFMFMEMTHSLTPGRLKKEVIIVLKIIYLPLYVVGGVLLLVKIWIVEVVKFLNLAKPYFVEGDFDGEE